MPYRANFPIPSEIDPPRQCLCLDIPNTSEWKAVVAGLISELTYWYNYERTGDDSGARCAAVWKEIYGSIDWSDMSCCCGSITIIFRWTVEGVLQQSSDGGETWEDAPESDPRNNSPVYPPMPEETSNLVCYAADGAVVLIRQGIGDQITEDMTRYTLGQLITDWVSTILQTSNPFQALIQIVTNQILALVLSALVPALTDGVYDKLRCILATYMQTDASFTDADWEDVREQILAQIAGIAGVFLEHLVFLLGKTGLTNLARSQAGDPDAVCCVECDPMNWDVFSGGETYGVVVEYGSNFVIADLSYAPSTVGEYYLRMKTPDASTCCVILGWEVISGGTLNISVYGACGETQDSGGAVSLQEFIGTDGNQANRFAFGATGACRVKITFL